MKLFCLLFVLFVVVVVVVVLFCFSSFSLEGEKTNHTTKEEEERSFAQKFCLLYIVYTRKVCLFSLITEEEEEDKWRSSTTRASIRFIT